MKLINLTDFVFEIDQADISYMPIPAQATSIIEGSEGWQKVIVFTLTHDFLEILIFCRQAPSVGLIMYTRLEDRL